MNRIGLALGAGFLAIALVAGCTDDNGDGDLGINGDTGTNGGASSPLDTDNGDSGTATPAAADGETVEATIEDGTFDDQDIEVGDTVVWTNEDSEPRVIASDDGSITSGEIPPGGTFEHTFDQRGLWMFSVDDGTELVEVNVTD